MELGKIQRLKVVKLADFGVYLGTDETEKVQQIFRSLHWEKLHC